jgi:hypothetical protein
MTDVDCPGGMSCEDSYTTCSPGDGTCESLGLICVQTQVLNQPNPENLCSDPATMKPKPTNKFCSPRTGACPP